ncbi:hypothetical protein MKEN_01359600 [Mycena kentingensis (nom. inval.)]|nr:hypothetical protein MKEN_01359600 [Mycena kentingensis (nom. inval.)]
MLLSGLLGIFISAHIANAATRPSDPCTAATTGGWVSSTVAHACELNVPFDKTRSQSVIDSVIKALSFYSLETYFIDSPNPLIPHHVNVRATLESVRSKTSGTGYPTDWDFNMAIGDAFNREADGHTSFAPSCTRTFTYNLPFSIATLAQSPTDKVAHPIFLANYDFPNVEDRPGMESYYESLGVHVRPLDGARILTINGVEASKFLVDLADESSLFKGIVAGFEDLNTRYLRLMTRYSVDTTTSVYTQDLGRMARRPIYPGEDVVRLRLQPMNGGAPVSVTIPWAAMFVADGNSTASFIAETCLADAPSARRRTLETRKAESLITSLNVPKHKSVVAPDSQEKTRKLAVTGATPSSNPIEPTLDSFGHFITLDIYRLADHPEVGVVYFEQFEPQDDTEELDYLLGFIKTLNTGLASLKQAGVEHILIDVSGNRGGFTAAEGTAIWTLWPQDLFPAFRGAARVSDLIRRLSDVAAQTQNSDSSFFYGLYRDANYVLLQNNSQFMDPPVPQVINGIQDAFSHEIIDDFGDDSSRFTAFTAPPFAAENIAFVSNSICGSACSGVTSYFVQRHGVRSAVFGGTPDAVVSPVTGGVKDGVVADLEGILFELETAGLQDDPTAPRPLPIQATFTLHVRNAIPFNDTQFEILEYVYVPGTKKYQFTFDNYNRPQKVWEFVADEFWGITSK